MMELGQALFGTGSNHSYEADWATEGLCLIAQIISEKRHGIVSGLLTSNDGEPAFENDVFIMRTYYWGECTCEYDGKVYAWEESHGHAETCYQTALINRCYLPDDTLEHKPGHSWDDDCMKQTCIEFGIDPNAPGGAVHCTCDYRKLWQSFIRTMHHSDACQMDKPNFVYRPIGVDISWYKHAGRGITCNKRKPSMTRWFEVIKHCIESLDQKTDLLE